MSRANAAVPFYTEGYIFTCHVNAAVTGKTFVKVAANAVDGRPAVGPAAAGNPALGVAGYDAPQNAGVTVYRAPSVMPVTAGAAITAGQQVQADANGKAVPLSTGTALGIALADAAANDDAKIALI
jgi:hypothetical protein